MPMQLGNSSTTENPAAADSSDGSASATTFEQEPNGENSKPRKKSRKEKKTEFKASLKTAAERRFADSAGRQRQPGGCGQVAWTHEAHPRKCMDLCFLLVLIAYWCMMVAIVGYAAEHGDWRKLMLPTDKNGNSCGMDNGVGGNYKNCENLYFANPLVDPKDRRCVAKCPESTGEVVCDCGYCANTTAGEAPLTQLQLMLLYAQDQQHYTFNMLPTKKAIFYCIPSGNVSETFGQLTGDNEMLAEWGRDMYENWEGVTWGLTVAAVMGFLFLYFIAWFTKPVVWTVLLTILGFSSCTFLLALYETDRVPSFFPTFIHDFLLDKIGVPDEVNEYSWGIDAFTIFWGGVLGVTAVIVLAMRKRLSIAIGVIQESAAALIGLPTLLMVPVTTMLFTMLMLPVTASGLFLIVSLREWRVSGWVYSDNLKAMLFAYGFGCVWMVTFIDSIQFTAISGAVCDWYFASNKSEKTGICDSVHVLTRSYYRVFRYHLGSLAFGSFIIAAVKVMKWVVAYVSKQVQAQFPGNVMVKYMIALLNCCVACFERLIKYLTETAFIQIAIWGTPFCKSAISGMKIALQNLGRLSFVTIMSKILILLGKIQIAFVSAMTCAFYLWNAERGNKDEAFSTFAKREAVNLVTSIGTDDGSGSLADSEELISISWSSLNPWGDDLSGLNEAIFRFPTFIALVGGYAVGFVFMECYSVTVHTVVVCFCEDEKHNDGSPDYPYFMAGSLEEVLGPASEYGRFKDRTGMKVHAKQMAFSTKVSTLRDRRRMDAKERKAADERDGGEPGNDGDEDNFDNERQKLQRKASKDVKKLMKEQERELAKVAKQVKDKKRKRMRNSKAASKRNVDKKSFVQAWKEDLKKKKFEGSSDAAEVFDKLDSDGSGFLDPAEMERFTAVMGMSKKEQKAAKKQAKQEEKAAKKAAKTEPEAEV